jgi:lysophospholipase L1-like esterase
MGKQNKLVGIVAAMLSATLGLAPLASAQTNNASVVYAALGDSFAAGSGSNTAPILSGLLCGRVQGAYPVLWANSHGISASNFSFAACGGARTTDVINNQLSVLSAATSLVTVTAGANDANYQQMLLTCSTTSVLSESQACLTAVNNFETYVQTQLPQKLASMFYAIQQAAPNAKIIATGYNPSFQIAGSDEACYQDLPNEPSLYATTNLIPIQQARDNLSAAFQLMQNTIQAAAAAANVTFVDPLTFFSAQLICVPPTVNPPSPWVNTALSGLLLVAYHPTAQGYSMGFLPALNQKTSALGF